MTGATPDDFTPDRGFFQAQLSAALALHRHHDRDAGISELQRIYAEVDAKFGAADWLVLEARLRLEGALCAVRPVKDSVQRLRDLRDSCAVLPRDHVVLQDTRELYAQYVRRAGDADTGIKLYRAELAERSTVLGRDAYQTALARTNLAVALESRARPADLVEALELCSYEVERRTALYGADHPVTWVAEMVMAGAYLKRAEVSADREAALADAASGLALATRVTDNRLAAFGEHDPGALRAMRQRARGLIAFGQPERAVWLLLRVQAAERATARTQVGRTELFLARALTHTGSRADWEQARGVATTARELLASRHGEKDSQVIVVDELIAALRGVPPVG